MAAYESETGKDDRVSFRSFIGPPMAGQSIVSFLKTRFKYFSEEEWIAKIGENDVLVNGNSIPPEFPLKAGDEVRYFAMRTPEPAVPTNITAIYEDEDLLIVNKPAHLPVHPTGRYLRNTLINILQHQRKLKTLFLAHRLDRETSGLCVLSKSILGKDKMYWAFFRGEVEKVYWALTWGRPHPASGVIDAPMGTDEARQKIRIKQVVGAPGAKQAKTKYHTLGTKWIHAPQWAPPEWPSMQKMIEERERKGGDPGTWPVSLVEARPITGRTNQIRVHLAHIGNGIVGDKLYDPNESVFTRFKDRQPPLVDARVAPPASRRNREEKSGNFLKLDDDLMRRLILDAHALHARKIRFRHPRTGKFLELEAPAPRSWQGLYDPR